MKGFTLIIGLLLLSGIYTKASDLKKSSISKVKVIHVSALDTLDGYEKYYAPIEEETDMLFTGKLDSMVSSWYVQNAFLLDSSELAEVDTLQQVLPDSVYMQRLMSMRTAVNLSYNGIVKNFITLYTQKRRKQVEVMLGLANYYFPIFEEIIDKHGLPHELKYLPIIESALNPQAYSKANAVGLWQFMYGTGKMYKLEINTFVDERRDPVKSTEAAIQYLEDLYNIYKDWHLVIAAYNCGPGNVNKAIRRSGGAKDYWKVYYRLPKETRGYVPAFIAANYVMNFYQSHNLYPHAPDFPIFTDTIVINKYLHLNQISEVIGIPLEQLRSLNPQYRRDIIPASENKTYPIVLPQDQIASFIDNQSDILAHKRDTYFPDNQLVNPQSRYTSIAPSEIKGRDKVYYTVKNGDNLGYIAEWFRVRASDLRYWNGIHGSLIRVGQKLKIYVPEGQGEYYGDFNRMSFTEKQKSLHRKPVTSYSTSASSYSNGSVYYTVRRGDNLWTIARKFPGVSNNDIIRLNNLKGDNIYPGQKLKIRP